MFDLTDPADFIAAARHLISSEAVVFSDDTPFGWVDAYLFDTITPAHIASLQAALDTHNA